MGGIKPKKKTQSAVGRRQPSGDDACDLRFRTDLMGIRTEIVANVRAGDTLEVFLLENGAMRSVVCRTRMHEIVGALSAFPGLAQLIGCMEHGVQYSALVEKVNKRSCAVFVWRVDE